MKTAEEWLRLLVEFRQIHDEKSEVCKKCGLWIPSDVVRVKKAKCPRCGGKTHPTDWQAVSEIIKRACLMERLKARRKAGKENRREKKRRGPMRGNTLLTRVKADYLKRFPRETRVGMQMPEFPEPLAWLNEAFRKAKMPIGRPFDIYEILELAKGERDGKPILLDKGEQKRYKDFIDRYRLDPEIRMLGKRVRTRKRRPR